MQRPEIFFDHRLTELNQILKEIYETTTGARKWIYETVEPFTLKKTSEKELLSISKGSGLNLTSARILMPDATPPDGVNFTVEVLEGEIKKYVIVGVSPETLNKLGLTMPNQHAYLTIYDATQYIYAWTQNWNMHIPPNQTAVIKLANKTTKDVTVQIIHIEGYTRPMGRYLPK